MEELLISILSTKEVYTTGKRMHTVFCSALPDDAFMKEICNNLLKGLNDMEKALGKTLSSDHTGILLNEDMNRDSVYIGARDYVSAFAHSPIPEKAKAAAKVYAVFEKLGSRVVSLGYIAETTKLNTLISELSAPDMQQSLDVFGGREWFTYLKEAQERFEGAYKTKTEAESKIDLPLVRDARTRILKCLKSLMNYVETNAEALKKAEFIAVAKQLDEITIDVTAIARARKTRDENKKAENNKTE